jgi:hypothetical protein
MQYMLSMVHSRFIHTSLDSDDDVVSFIYPLLSSASSVSASTSTGTGSSSTAAAASGPDAFVWAYSLQGPETDQYKKYYEINQFAGGGAVVVPKLAHEAPRVHQVEDDTAGVASYMGISDVSSLVDKVPLSKTLLRQLHSISTESKGRIELLSVFFTDCGSLRQLYDGHENSHHLTSSAASELGMGVTAGPGEDCTHAVRVRWRIRGVGKSKRRSNGNIQSDSDGTGTDTDSADGTDAKTAPAADPSAPPTWDAMLRSAHALPSSLASTASTSASAALAATLARLPSLSLACVRALGAVRLTASERKRTMDLRYRHVEELERRTRKQTARGTQTGAGAEAGAGAGTRFRDSKNKDDVD